jgi:hypothetical protein
VLASLYTSLTQQTTKKPEEPVKTTEEKPKEAVSDISDEGKLKLFVGGLYFQSESRSARDG